MPYYLKGITDHPLTHGAVCPRGLAGHHMAYHPLRIVTPHKFVGKSDNSVFTGITYEEAIESIAQSCLAVKGSVAILDQIPNRSISEVYRSFSDRIPNGIYLTSPTSEESSLLSLQKMPGKNCRPLGYDFEHAALIVSFGAPLLDGWGIPGRMSAIANNRKESGTRIVQIDHRHSRTAMQSDEWIAVNPNTERYLALSIANVIISERLYPRNAEQSISDFSQFKNIVKDFSPASTSAITGIEEHIVRQLARQMTGQRSTIILSGSDPGGGPFDSETEKIIASLNILVGNIGHTGGILERNETPGYSAAPEYARWNSVPNHSINLLIVDAADPGFAIPWKLIERKLVPETGIVVSLSPIINDIAAHADILIPGPALFETLQDVPTAAGSVVPTFSISAPLLPHIEGTTEPSQFVRDLAGKLNVSIDIPDPEEIVKEKIAAIYKKKTGTLYSYSDTTAYSLHDISSESDLHAKLIDGGEWIGEPVAQRSSMRCTIGLSGIPQSAQSPAPLQLTPFGWRGTTSAAQISPILSKLFQESELRDNNGTVAINPRTATELEITSEKPALLSTAEGSMKVKVRISTSVRPGSIEASVGPIENDRQTPAHPAGTTIIDLCTVTGDGTWRITPAQLLKA
jgi:anaerobic selenocysteine-containing dehydrogenase